MAQLFSLGVIATRMEEFLKFVAVCIALVTAVINMDIQIKRSKKKDKSAKTTARAGSASDDAKYKRWSFWGGVFAVSFSGIRLFILAFVSSHDVATRQDIATAAISVVCILIGLFAIGVGLYDT